MSSKVIVGRYELLEKIGDGGMAVVYKAKDRLLNRQVAVKILKPEYTNDEKFINNFRKESHAAASLSHPNIVSIYDVGKEGNINYIVMELVEGKPLSRIIKEEAPLNYNRVIDYTKQIASGLSAAHKHGIIHRDVKPHNILVNEDGIAKIADFGIAKAVSTTTIVDGTNETVMGSVHYFSPEQARGGYVDEKSDIYSLGIVMYEMLTGEVPFDGDNPVTVALMHINDPITPPSKLVGGIPPGLERIVLKATDKYQSNRFKSAEDVITALNNLDLVSRVVGNSMFVSQEEIPQQKIQPKPEPQGSIYVDPVAEKPVETDRQNEVDPNGQKKKKKKIIIAVIILLVVICGLLIAAYFMGMIGPRDIKVPNLKGKTVEKAQQICESYDLRMEVVGYEKSNKYDTGEITQQDPDSGFMARKYQKIEVKVSKGSDSAVVPQVVGMSEEAATKMLEDLGYKVKVREVTDVKPKGEVLKQDPDAGTKLKKGNTISIDVSDGKGKEEVSVPSLLGLSEEQAKTKLTEAGLSAGNVSEGFSDDYEEGTVMEQQYEAGQKIEEGSSVSFKISKGSKSAEGSVDVDVNLDDAPGDDEIVYLTISVNDDNGAHNVISDRKMNRKDGTVTVNVEGKGKGTITVILNGSAVDRRNVDFSSGAQE